MIDLLIKNGKLINGTVVDIAIENGKIVDVKESITEEASDVLELNKKQYVSAGWIDDHVHCYEKMDLYYDYPDEIGVKAGVTSIIDAGTTGAENIYDFYETAKEARTNVYAMLNISKWGIVEQDELADLEKIQEKLAKKAVEDLSDFIVGIKARMSKTVIGDNGITPLKLAKKIQEENKHIPLMVHIGSAPPELDETLSYLSKGDIVTHCFNGKSNGILDQGINKIKPFARDAYEKGIIFDVGHGTASFNFHVAEVALKEGIKASSISTDIYYTNRTEGPVYDFATTMEKMHVIGYSWEEIIEKVTAAPAANFRLENKGQLKKGYDADLTIFTIEEKEKDLVDSDGNHRQTKEKIQPLKAIVGGNIYEVDL
ncbi:amidohydrolase/deacetylase family metallohydrolase [Atopococcus tabaci]|uniref:amidohydrolase/deacetylase family metallohydrolase n=1 Tax=Atopococcus tabaci TaxID=269774 RepID=UPI00041AC3C1|nr:amidohydrolase/deacetylase family metallohydrolase [Atopococcus tabaci]